MLDWGTLEVFLAAAREGSFARAADRLDLNTSTVQRKVTRLEAELSTRLVHRSARGLRLTEEGATLLEHAKAMEEEVFALHRRITSKDTRISGTVRVSTVDDVGMVLVAPLLEGFRRRYPELTVHLTVESAFARLEQSVVDVAIRLGRPPEQPDVVVHRLGQLQVGLYGSRRYLKKHPPPSRVEELFDHDVVRCGELLRSTPMEQVMEKHADPSRVALRSDSLAVQAAAIQAGLGLGFVGHFIRNLFPKLVPIELDLPPLVGPVWLVVHVDLRRNARVRAFVDWIKEQLAAQIDALDNGSPTMRLQPGPSTVTTRYPRATDDE